MINRKKLKQKVRKSIFKGIWVNDPVKYLRNLRDAE